ncbi:hypothetical protein FLL82_16720 [Vibrio cholerae]|nr:hypothetical protein FLL82_16720 [Vibrio cholerae]
MIWLSVNFDVFIKNLLRLWYEKILLLTSVNLWGDYPKSVLKDSEQHVRETANKRLKRDCQRVAFPVPLSRGGFGCCV